MVKYQPKQQYSQNLDNDTLDTYKRAKLLYQEEQYQKTHKLSYGDQKWFQRLITSGTLHDKISALAIKIRDQPNYSLEPLQELLELVQGLAKREDQLKGLLQMRDLFTQLLFKTFHPATFQAAIRKIKKPTDEQLVLAFFNHNLKRIFTEYIKIVEEKQSDPLPYIRRQALNIMIELVGTNNESTNYLITSVVNKFGDSDKLLVVTLTKQLSLQLNKTPDQALKVLKEIESFMYRPNLKQDAQYYGLNFLNQINLSKLDEMSVNYILKMLFKFFTKLVGLDDEATQCSKLLSQILRGINKALPFAKGDMSNLESIYKENENNLFKIMRKTTNFKIKIQTLFFIYQVLNKSQNFSDRYFRALYELMEDPEIERTKMLELFFDLLFLSMKQDTSVPRQKAFIKRLLQVASQSSVSFVMTSLVFTSKILDQIPSLKTMINQSEYFLKDDEEEYFKDADESAQQTEEQVNKVDNKDVYDPTKRDPQFCKAESTSLWELPLLLNHFHPSVREAAQAVILCKKVLAPKENPLIQYDLSTFLNTFIEKSSRKTKRLSSQLSLVDQDLSKLQTSQDDQNNYLMKYLKQKFKNDQNKEQLFGPKCNDQYLIINLLEKLSQEDQDAEEDAFADTLFEKELQKTDTHYDSNLQQQILLKVDEDDDMLVDENDDELGEFDEDDDDLGDMEDDLGEMDQEENYDDQEELDEEQSDDAMFEDSAEEGFEEDTYENTKNKKKSNKKNQQAPVQKKQIKKQKSKKAKLNIKKKKLRSK